MIFLVIRKRASTYISQHEVNFCQPSRFKNMIIIQEVGVFFIGLFMDEAFYLLIKLLILIERLLERLLELERTPYLIIQYY